jgi:serine/threonine-protein kinase
MDAVHALAGGPGGAGVERPVMIVESDPQMQEVLRKNLKLSGYRVLMTADPARAVARFRQDTTVADGIVFNAQQIGEPALEMFNELDEDERTRSVPAMLLLGEHQKAWKTQTQTAEHRVVLTMPITMRQFRTALEKMLTAKTTQTGKTLPSR